jgi:hypothetical protein
MKLLITALTLALVAGTALATDSVDLARGIDAYWNADYAGARAYFSWACACGPRTDETRRPMSSQG